MKSLVHIESQKEQYEGYKYFVTITLPKSKNRSGPVKQREYMDKYVRKICEQHFEEAIGVYEYTKKGNIHAHLVIKPVEIYKNIEFKDEDAKDNAYLTTMSAYMKYKPSIIDVQLVKNIKNIYEYFMKDIEVSKNILDGKSPFLKWGVTKQTVKPIGILIHELQQMSTLDLDYSPETI